METWNKVVGCVVVVVILGLAACCGPERACQPTDQADRDLPAILKSHALVVITRTAPTTYFVGKDGPAGPEYDLATAFAKDLGVEVRFVVKDSVAGILTAMAAGQGDIGAGAITRTPERERLYTFGPDTQAVRQQVVVRQGTVVPSDPAGLVGRRILVAAGTSYVERLAELKKRHPGLSWDTTDTLATMDILEKVSTGEVDCTVADSNVVAAARAAFPNLVVAFPVTGEQHLAWVIQPDAPKLAARLSEWFGKRAR